MEVIQPITEHLETDLRMDYEWYAMALQGQQFVS